MLSEWLKIMLEEIARKNAAAQVALGEDPGPGEERVPPPAPAADRTAG
jgi:hypothetical protein